MERCMPKVSELRARFPDKDIQVDGGVSTSNIETCAHAGEFGAQEAQWCMPRSISTLPRIFLLALNQFCEPLLMNIPRFKCDCRRHIHIYG
jgi:hypothetical protein